VAPSRISTVSADVGCPPPVPHVNALQFISVETTQAAAGAAIEDLVGLKIKKNKAAIKLIPKLNSCLRDM
jgi:hypothetical protein